MSHNTISLNKQRQPLAHLESVWLFGYGSLIYKTDFAYLDTKPACIYGWQRRFWQGSHDHRGTPQAPGRVLTLIEAPGARCAGMAYQVTPDTFEHLDHREKNGYLRVFTPLHWLHEAGEAEGIVYLATPDNAAYLGPASDSEIAAHIASSAGPSGPNSEYVLKLAQALRAMNEHDEHVFAIERELLKLL
ncbi:gamma-glutamylcyclotransferase [Rheinheimera nanhaiensis]|uniref:glutathione-specific gamma-glutamylcyclotransferase n=1 Tax=Rheinheimera nanhaiensis E407-8 TaxID=562729 RepID=I1DUN5_9GAMM|nr:gamma-glutamylcyclotransferase [Rheinheimera nanhaiensis]GAB57763.1 cation transport protein ChaC [Rheinheimera nanhaiensis E407-8]